MIHTAAGYMIKR